MKMLVSKLVYSTLMILGIKDIGAEEEEMVVGVSLTSVVLKNVRLYDCSELLTHSGSVLAGGRQGADGGGEEEAAEESSETLRHVEGWLGGLTESE